MNLIINTVNLKIGGAFQRSISFLNELKNFNSNTYHVFYNSDIGKQIDIDGFPDNFKFYFFDNSPASLRYQRTIIKEFNRLEKLIKPDVIFSFVGPAYWRPQAPHLVGFGVPHIVYDDYDYVKNYGIKTKVEMAYKKFWTKYEANFYVVQTEDVRNRLSKRLGVSIDKIFLVSNGIGKQYQNVVVTKGNSKEVKKLLLISTYRPSKNFGLIQDVIPLLEGDKFIYEFHITIREDDYNLHFKGFEKTIINHGHVKAKDCPDLYNSSDAMFLPSHLECFSASYPEAMKMERPILTSDLSFAHTVCGESALYFNNCDPVDTADKIKKLFHSKDLYDSLVNAGRAKLNDFDTSYQQAEKYLKICQDIINSQKF